MDKLALFFKALADQNRLRILNLLQVRKLCVCELTEVLEVTQPSISRHLKKLIKAGLIKNEQDSLWTNYYIKSNNPYAKLILQHLKQWLSKNPIAQEDINNLKKVHRVKVCCSSSQLTETKE